MSAQDKNDLARAWAFAEKLLAEEDADEERDLDRVDQLSDEELEKEMHQEGYDVARVPNADEFLARGMARRSELAEANGRSQKTPAAPARSRRTRWIATLIAATFALLVVLAVTKGSEVVALFKNDSGRIGPDNERQPQKPQKQLPTPEERAEALRDEAIGTCDAALWAVCRQKLDAAQRLDPAGENEERVRKARRAIEMAAHAGPEDKPTRRVPLGSQ